MNYRKKDATLKRKFKKININIDNLERLNKNKSFFLFFFQPILLAVLSNPVLGKMVLRRNRNFNYEETVVVTPSYLTY